MGKTRELASIVTGPETGLTWQWFSTVSDAQNNRHFLITQITFFNYGIFNATVNVWQE